MPLIEDIPSPIERDTYRQRLARLLRVDERILVGVPSVARRSPAALRRRVTAEKQPTTGVEQAKLSPPRSATLLQEGYCLGVLLRRPDLVYRVDRSLQERGLARLSVNDFETSDYQMILRTIEASLAQYHSDPLHFVLNGLSLPLMDLADQLLERTAKLDSNEEKVLEDLLRALVDLRRRRIRLYLNQVRYLLEEPQPADESLLDEYQQTVHNYSQMLKLLDQAYGRFTTHLT